MPLSPEEQAQQIIDKEIQKRTRTLDLSGLTGLTSIPDNVCKMIWLNKIKLNGTQVSSLESLEKLVQLQIIRCDNTQVRSLEPLAKLAQLQTIFCNNTQISSLEPLSQLDQLKLIKCDNTKISSLGPLAKLAQLQIIRCSNTQVSNLDPLDKLDQLQEIWCGNTKISSLEPLAKLDQLQKIWCSNTRVSSLEPLDKLDQLQIIWCENTQISSLEPLSTLSKLNMLFCNQTNITNLKTIVPLLKSHLKHTNFNNCPLITPPIEFAQQGTQAIVEYFDQLGDEKTPLNELKIIFLGEGASGKTSLIKRLRNEDFDQKEEQTHGIRIRKTDFDVEGENISAHLWDFGGQEVMHATHQFFLSQRCIYVLLLNSRTDDKAEYWLKHANSFGGNSPVLVVLNKIDENPSFDVNRKVLKEKYPQIKGYFPLSCQNDKGLEDFKQALQEQMALSNTRLTPFPSSWLEVKRHFETMSDDYIESNQYKEICANKSVDKPFSQSVLLQFLHDLGMVINFKNLKNFDTQILNPLWLTNGVYRIINSKRVTENKGILHEDDFDKVINDPRYKAGNTTEKPYSYPRKKLAYIVRVMQEFELCYPLDHESYVIPQLLPVAEPDFTLEGATIHFEVQFPEFLPDSIFPRLMVKLHPYIDNGLRWRSGMVLYKPVVFNAKARIRSDREDKKISIDVCGDEPRRLLSFIRETLKEVVADFSKLKFDEMVAVPNDQRKTILREYTELVIYEEAQEKEIFIAELRRKILIKDILNGVEEAVMRSEETKTSIKAFVSYSHLDIDGLKALESALAPLRQLENLKLWTDHAIDAGTEWEEEIFKQLEASDIVLCLISQDFINSDFCNRELNTALENHKKGKQTVVPIQWRNCDWDGLPIAALQGSAANWIKSQSDQDVEWTQVSKKLKPIISKAKQQKMKKTHEI